jgi:hypothetical protein
MLPTKRAYGFEAPSRLPTPAPLTLIELLKWHWPANESPNSFLSRAAEEPR